MEWKLHRILCLPQVGCSQRLFRNSSSQIKEKNIQSHTKQFLNLLANHGDHGDAPSLQVVTSSGERLGEGAIFAAGDCAGKPKGVFG